MQAVWRGGACAAVFTVLSAGAPPAVAQERSETFRATVYGWFPGISGTTQFPSGAGGPSFNVNAKDLLGKLDMAFMGTFEARGEKWGGLIDWVYTDISADKSGTRELGINGQPLPVGVTANLNLGVKSNIVTLAGTYALVETPASSFGSVFGARMLSMDQTLGWAFAGTGPLGVARSGSTSVSETNWDAILGFRGRVRFGDGLHWFVPYYADIGTGQSQLTWQAIIGLGYSFGVVDVLAAWRYLDYNFKSSSAVQSLTFNGVAVGVSFRF
jgi:hypothetical protein